MNLLHFSQFLHSTLQALQEGGGSLTQVEMVDAVDRLMRLPEAVMERGHARYSMVREFDYCLALAQAYLRKVGYLTRSARGVWVLTAEGKVIDVVDETVSVETCLPRWESNRTAEAL